MSMSALLRAAVKLLRESGGFSREECSVQAEGHPMPMAGTTFVAVHPGYYSLQPLDAGNSYTIGINVTISYRSADIPYDAQGEELFLSAMNGFEPIVGRIIAALNKNYDLPPLADTYLSQGTGTFNTGNPLLLETDLCRYIPRDGTWWTAGPDELAGFSLTLTFGGLRFIQYQAEQ